MRTKLKEYRLKKGLTQANLAGLSGVGIATIRDLEGSDVNPRASTMEAVSRGLNVPLLYIFPMEIKK